MILLMRGRWHARHSRDQEAQPLLYRPGVDSFCHGRLAGCIDSTGEADMKIEGSVALVTGANRGLGKAYVEALRAAGAAKIYAGARQPLDVIDSRVIPIRLDVTSQADVQSAAQQCQDVNILINNAGVMLKSPMLANRLQ